MSDEESWQKLSFWQGFFWARDLVQAMGYDIPREAEVCFVRALAGGEVTLRPTPEEFIRDWERQSESQMSDPLKRRTYQMNQGDERRKLDHVDRRIARHYLATLDPQAE